LIEGVRIVDLKRSKDARGELLHMLRSDAPHFLGFGEIYFSSINPGAVKAWHLLENATRHYAVPVGNVKIVLYDDRAGSKTAGAVEEVLLGEDHYGLLIIPPRIWSGFAALGGKPALVADCTTLPHNPKQSRKRDPGDPAIPYRWEEAGR
jgi:dTDP-4-dehydrorhamnose 3,5-epimerase